VVLWVRFRVGDGRQALVDGQVERGWGSTVEDVGRKARDGGGLVDIRGLNLRVGIGCGTYADAGWPFVGAVVAVSVMVEHREWDVQIGMRGLKAVLGAFCEGTGLGMALARAVR
jgi:hypothetical protein